jgi:hypothetical protein
MLAQSTPQADEKRGPCKKWADELKKDKEKAKKLMKAVVTALKESAKTTPAGIETRRKLLDSSASAQAEILRILNADPTPPIFDPNFPAETWFKFFVPEVPVAKNTKKGISREKAELADVAEEHCLHIFALPEPGTDLSGQSDKIIFDYYLMCCYQPW